MSAGGRREGAGRKPGVPNKRTLAQAEAVEKSGLTPLDFMLSVMRDGQNATDVRLDAAKSAAPYVHAKLSSIDAKLSVDGQLVINVNKPA